MFYRLCILWTVLLGIVEAKAQDKIRKLPPNINQPSINLYAPFISGDGQTIVYLSDYTDDGHHSMRWSTKKTVSTWNDERDVNRLINRPSLNYRGGYSLSFDGDMLLFTSRKSGIGGFDIWYSNRRGNDWEAPVNIGMPINSRKNDGAPTISPDGKFLYFMRCEKMSEYGGAAGCKILVSEKSYNGWQEPKELPVNINTGNSQTPRILADGQTMIFASDKFGGKGGLDLFMTTKEGETWSQPVPMNFINTEDNDQFISIPAKGRYLYADIQGPRDRELVQILIPEAFQPANVMRIQGKVTDAVTGDPLNANLTIFNIGERDRLWNEKTGDKGEFAVVLKEGGSYDLAIDLDDPSYMYFSKVYDFTKEIGPRDKERLTIELRPIAEGDEYKTDVYFKDYSAELDDNSTFELRRIAALLRKNQSMRIALLVHQDNYMEDSLQVHPDLTELNIDSIYTVVRRPIVVKDSLDMPIVDSLVAEKPDSLNVMKVDTFAHNSDTVQFDTVSIENAQFSTEAQRPFEQDSLEITAVRYEVIEQLQIKKTYHNDRTERQAMAIKDYLIGRGVEPDRMEVKVSRKDRQNGGETKEKRNVEVKIKILQL